MEDYKHYLERLADTPHLLQQFVTNVSDSELRWKSDADSFSLIEHICHLKDIEVEGYSVRIQRLLHESEPTLSDIDGTELSIRQLYNQQSLTPALEQFSLARQANINVLNEVSTEQLERRGTLENFGPVTLAQIVQLMFQHDQEHLKQLTDLHRQLARRVS